MKALFLAGGAGTRLWPLSRKRQPKQLHALVGDRSLITQTVERVADVISPEDVWIITGEDLRDRVSEHCPWVPWEHLITEPYPLGTNLAVGLGLIHIAAEDPDATILLSWADSYVGNVAAFISALKQAEQLVSTFEGVILAVPPTYPATCYGYMEVAGDEPGSGALKIIRFEEKPTLERATVLSKTGRHYWNSGFSVWRASSLLGLMKEHVPDHYDALIKVASVLGTPDEANLTTQCFEHLPPVSIDTAIFEKAANMAAIAAAMDWSDIGSWGALYDVQERGGENVTKGPVVTVDTNKCLIYSKHRLVATLGISDLVIVETDDAVLVVHKDQTERLKELYDEVKKIGGDKYL